jgi:hypothetical protein
VHNDSGNPPLIFAVDRSGKLLRSFRVDVPNVDWEDLTLDDQGHLYVGEIGNNDGRLPVRAIYRIDEPDPASLDQKKLSVTLASFYKFPKGGRFDAEGLFLDGGQACVVTKYRDGREAEIFAIPLNPPAPLLRPALPRRVATLKGCTEPVTGASLHAGGKRLAIVTTSSVRVYKRDPETGWRPAFQLEHHEADVEAITWDGEDLILASEDRSLYRISRERLALRSEP